MYGSGGSVLACISSVTIHSDTQIRIRNLKYGDEPELKLKM